MGPGDHGAEGAGEMLEGEPRAGGLGGARGGGWGGGGRGEGRVGAVSQDHHSWYLKKMVQNTDRKVRTTCVLSLTLGSTFLPSVTTTSVTLLPRETSASSSSLST